MARTYDRFLRQRLSRRRLLAGAGGAALGAATLAACGGGGADDEARTGDGTAAAVETPRPGGFFNLRQQVSYPNLSPFGVGITNLAQALFVGFTLYDHLWYVPTDTGDVIPFLADSVPEISEDGLTIVATMSEGFFHDKPPVDGRQVLASDVKASVERFREVPPIGFSWLHEVFDRIEIPDDRTVVFHQNRPWFWFFTSSNAGSPISSSIVPEEVIDDEDIVANDPIGSGRWTLGAHDNFTNIRLDRFPNWREQGLPYLDGVQFRLITEDTQAIASFQAGDIDRITALESRELEALQNRLGDQIDSDSDLSRAFRSLALKNEPPFDDERVRHGINLALDRQETMQVLNPPADGQFSGPVPPAHEVFVLDESDPDLQEYFRYDPADARAMLEAANFPFDQEFELKHSNLGTSPDLADLLQQQLGEVGMNVKTTQEDLIRWLTSTITQGDFQMTCFTHLPYEDPSLPMSFHLGASASTSGQPNPSNYDDPEVNEAILAAAEELDEEERIAKTKEAQRVIIRKWAPMLNLYSPITYNAWWNYVKGQVIGRGSFGLFRSEVWLDK